MEQIRKAAQALRNSDEEQKRIERTLGKALIAKMSGEDRVDLAGLYKELGGSDVTTMSMFDGGLTASFAELNVGLGKEAMSQLARNDRLVTTTAAKSESSVEIRAAVEDLPGTHFNTLKAVAPELNENIKRASA